MWTAIVYYFWLCVAFVIGFIGCALFYVGDDADKKNDALIALEKERQELAKQRQAFAKGLEVLEQMGREVPQRKIVLGDEVPCP